MKRAVDLLFSLLAVMALAPLLLTVWLLLLIQNHGRPFFIQKRPGIGQKPFYLIKFKTMNDNTDLEGNLLPDNARLTKIGKIIRKLSLDELPQLFNVIKGEMSLVGPRPLLFKYVALYSPLQNRRHEVRPGITGWAQVNGRNSISWSEKFMYDVYYVDHISFSLDFRILCKTVIKVVRREGINQSAERPMQPFNGFN